MKMTKLALSIALVASLAFFAAHAHADAPDSAKLDKILHQQDQILKELAEIKSEVRIVKIRASSTG
jgi:uncharacterized protein YcnI